ncbi:hypothetical protein TCAL_14505 [Tigriopus californicus]|uniref:Exonuclease domain-containing protein n=1 Tax=Tigriopus californicus TaxID=6832 RepID=A0A553PRQ3_TIGCA|nr:hypothetical protein TCAL_14505 [Tigriopus californicus]
MTTKSLELVIWWPLDAEFVILTPRGKVSGEELGLITVKAGRRLVELFIERPHFLRGGNIRLREQYSGIFPGDLDPTHSSHQMTSLKRTYKKIRHLVDVGCIFVDNGLKNDFDMLGSLCPRIKWLIRSTCSTCHLEVVILKFLAWYFLDKHIQKDCHNSNGDAGAALEFYRIYLDVKAQGTVEGRANQSL